MKKQNKTIARIIVIAMTIWQLMVMPVCAIDEYSNQSAIVELNKYEPCNELEIPSDVVGGTIIAAKMTGHNPMLVWTSEQLTEEAQNYISSELKGFPGVGNPKNVEFISDAETSSYGMTVSVSSGVVRFDHPHNWALIVAGAYRIDANQPEEKIPQIDEVGPTQDEQIPPIDEIAPDQAEQNPPIDNEPEDEKHENDPENEEQKNTPEEIPDISGPILDPKTPDEYVPEESPVVPAPPIYEVGPAPEEHDSPIAEVDPAPEKQVPSINETVPMPVIPVIENPVHDHRLASADDTSAVLDQDIRDPEKEDDLMVMTISEVQTTELTKRELDDQPKTGLPAVLWISRVLSLLSGIAILFVLLSDRKRVER